MTEDTPKSIKVVRVDVTEFTLGGKVATVVADLPRFLLPQLKTHERLGAPIALALSAQSSRAVPVEEMLRLCTWTPRFDLGAGGMSHGAPVSSETQRELEREWNVQRAFAIKSVQHMTELCRRHEGGELCRGQVNRLLEPFMMTRVVMTGAITEQCWGNFFKLRCSKLFGGQANPQSEMANLADQISLALEMSDVVKSNVHIPLVDRGGRPTFDDAVLACVKAGRVSFRRMEKKSGIWRRFSSFIANNEWGPLEHVVICDVDPSDYGRPIVDFVPPDNDDCLRYRAYGRYESVDAYPLRAFYDPMMAFQASSWRNEAFSTIFVGHHSWMADGGQA